MDVGEIVRHIVVHNEAFTRKARERYLRELPPVQHPWLTLIAPADSNLHADVLGMELTGRVYVVRNAAGHVASNMGSIDLGVRIYKTPVVMVLGHTSADALKLAVNRVLSRKNGSAGRGKTRRVRKLKMLTGAAHGSPTPALEIELRQFFEEIAGLITIADKYTQGEMQLAFLAQSHVDIQVGTLVEHYRSIVRRGALTVIGAVHDENGAFTDTFGRVIITNINGITDVGEIQDLAAAFVRSVKGPGESDSQAEIIQGLLREKIRRI